MVERQPSKLFVAGSIPVSRSILLLKGEVMEQFYDAEGNLFVDEELASELLCVSRPTFRKWSALEDFPFVRLARQPGLPLKHYYSYSFLDEWAASLPRR